MDLYYLDVDLKNLLSKYIYRIEVHFRTQLVYYASNKFKIDPLWYVEERNFLNFKEREFYFKIYLNLKKHNDFIKKHHRKYRADNYAPAWKTLEFLTFGQILNIFSNLKDITLKDSIATVYEVTRIRTAATKTAPEVVISAHECLAEYFKAIINIRNICSHSGVLFDYKQRKGIAKIPDHRYRIQTNNQVNLSASFHLIRFILSRVSYNRADDLKSDLDTILQDAIAGNQKLKTIINHRMGFNI